MCPLIYSNCELNNVFLQSYDYKILGMYVGMSIVQVGPGFPCFLPVVYKYLSTGEYLNNYVNDSDVPDAGARQLLHEVCVSFRVVFLAGIINVCFSLGPRIDCKSLKTEEMMGLLGETGYKKPPSF